jgi:hypothetical protein
MVEDIHSKLREQIDRIEHLITLIPPDAITWKPQLQNGASDLGHLLGHLLDCFAGFCAVFDAAFPNELKHIERLQSLPVNHACETKEALVRIREYAEQIEQGFTFCSDDDLRRRIPSVFVPQGETVLTFLLGNLEHLISHKYQLFFYLKLFGLPVSSKDIYHWRGSPEA